MAIQQHRHVPILRCLDIERGFSGVSAIRDVTLTVESGEIYGLVGPNGAGKTTLINAITGFFPPSRGRIYFYDTEITGIAPYKVAALGIARTFQNLALFNGMTTLQNILIGRHVHMHSSVWRTIFYELTCAREESDNRAYVEEIIEFLQLQYVRDHLIDDLPIGIKKRVELARALALNPKLLILDEPMAGMNQEEKEYMVRFILDARDQLNTTVLLIEHHMDVITGICDRVLALNYGGVIDEGTPDVVIQNPQVIEAYVGTYQ